MTEKKSWRQLGCPALADWFVALNPDAFLVRGRDSHLLREFLNAQGCAVTQVLEGMLYYPARTVPTFLADAERWLLRDALQQEAELALFLTDGDPPPCYHDYADLKDTGVASVQIEEAWQRAKQELERWVAGVLDAPAKSSSHPTIRRKVMARERVAV